jgi:hypothetical protein
VGVRFEVDISGPLAELDRLVKGPDPAEFEAALAAGLAGTQAKVHEITGFLKQSGHPQSEMDEGSWRGTISYARHPGIFELARGDRPTRNHPEGGHYFFSPAGEAYTGQVKRILVAFVTNGEDEGGAD